MTSFIRSRLVQAMVPRARTAGVLAAVISAGLFAAACDVHGLSDPGTLYNIVVSPNPQSLAINGTQQFTAVGTDFSGARVSFTPVWSVASGGGAINSSGVFTASTVPGTFNNTVTATAAGRSGTATVVVTVGPLASISLTPNPQSLVVGTTQQYVAVGKDAGGNVVQFAPTWSVVAGGGTINGTGMFTAGPVTGTFANAIKASSGAISATATITQTAGPLAAITVIPNPIVLNTGAAQQFTATGKDANGNAVAFTPVWSVANGGGAIDASGMFTAGNTPGTYSNTVTATSGALSGTATVVVTAGPVASITVTPNPVTLLAGTAQQFSATARDQGGNIVQITPTWSVVNGGGSIGANSGLFTAGSSAGTFANTVQATAGGVSGAATVNVTSPPPPPPSLAAILVTPKTAVILPNAQQQFNAVGLDGGGNSIAVSPVWTLVRGGGSVNAITGLFTSNGTQGIFAVRATSGAISDTGQVTVTAVAAVLTTITVTPNPGIVTTGQTQQFTAVGRDQNGNIMVITPVWSVANPLSGSIVAGGPTAGLFTAAAAGSYTNDIVATAGGISGKADVIVGAVPPPATPYIDLKTAAANGIMAGTAVSCTGSASTINADVSIAPGNTITGTCVITGTTHLNDPIAIQGQVDLTAAYNQAAGKPCGATVAAIGGTTKTPGVYCGSAIDVTGTLTLDALGDPNATFLFQSGSSLIVAGNVLLQGGAQAKNVYWQVGSSATLGTASQFKGNILALTSITLVTGTNLTGRALARNGAVSAGTGSTITLP